MFAVYNAFAAAYTDNFVFRDLRKYLCKNTTTHTKPR